jgi:hypothetical protein
VINLETSNELIWNLQGNVINLETSNALIWNLQGNVINLETSNALIWNLQGNVINLETSNALLWNLPIVANTSTLTGVKKGDILCASSANEITTLSIGGDGQVLTVETGLPAWKAPTGGGTTLQNITESGGFTGISNTDPQYTLQVGSNVVVDDIGSDVLWVRGVIYSTKDIEAFGAVRAEEMHMNKIFIKNTTIVAERPARQIRLK